MFIPTPMSFFSIFSTVKIEKQKTLEREVSKVLIPDKWLGDSDFIKKEQILINS